MDINYRVSCYRKLVLVSLLLSEGVVITSPFFCGQTRLLEVDENQLFCVPVNENIAG